MKEILDAINRPIVVLDPEGNILYANAAAMHFCGQTATPPLRCSDLFGTCPEREDGLPCPVKLCLKRGESLTWRHGCKGGGRLYEAELSIVPEGQYKGMVVMSLADITEQAKVENLLEHNAEGLTILNELSSAFLAARGMDRALELAMGLLRDHYDADMVAVAMPSSQGDELDFIAMAGEAEAGFKSSREPLRQDDMAGAALTGRCPVIVTDFGNDTRYRPGGIFERFGIHSGMAVPMAVEGNPLGVICIMYAKPKQLDTAELWYLNVVANTFAVYIMKERTLKGLERSEAYLTSVLDGIGEGVVVVDRAYRIVSANRSCRWLTGKPSSEAIGEHCHTFLHSLDKPCFDSGMDCPVRAVFETGAPYSVIHRRPDAAGRDRYYQTNAYPIADASGRIESAVETIFEVSDRVTLERDLEKRIRELEEFYDMAVGRELRMIELREDIKRLEDDISRLKARG